MTEEYLYTTQLFLAIHHFSVTFTYQNTNTSSSFRIFSNDCHRILSSQTSMIRENTHHHYYREKLSLGEGNRGSDPLILNFGNRWSCAVKLAYRPLNNPSMHLGSLGGSQNRSGNFG
jgi:hypothetical protein